MVDLPQWPRIEASCYTTGGGEVTINGTSHAIDTSYDANTTRTAIRNRAAELARSLERAVRVTVVDYAEGQTVHLLVSPDASIEPEPNMPVEPHKDSPAQQTAALDNDPKPKSKLKPSLDEWTNSSEQDISASTSQPKTLAPAPTPEQAPLTRRQARESFLNQAKHDKPASRGIRGMLNQIGFRLAPSTSEQAERDDIHKVSQHWAGPRTIAVVNGKGGAGKTPTTILLAAVLARYGGGGVLAWDNNQTRGTLGWRTEQAAHDATLLDLLPAAEQLLSPGAQLGDLAHYTHHQTDDRFDVLRSKPKVLADAQRFTQDDVDTIHSVAAKFYRLIIIDSGNDESDPLWRQMIDHTDQLVVATTTSDEKAEAGALLLEDLEKTGNQGQQLADNAVVVVSQAEANAKAADLQYIAKGFESLAREVVTVPYDPAMVDGHLRYDALRDNTQRAWLRAAAAVADGLN